MLTIKSDGRVRVFNQRTKEVTISNLIEYLSGCKEDSHHFAHVISGVYKFDSPWTWHLRKVIDANGGTSSFRNTDWAKQFIFAYVSCIMKAEQDVETETGFRIGLQIP